MNLKIIFFFFFLHFTNPTEAFMIDWPIFIIGPSVIFQSGCGQAVEERGNSGADVPWSRNIQALAYLPVLEAVYF